MLSLSKLSVRARLAVLIVIPVLGLVVFGVMTKMTTNTVRIGGPLFNEIKQNYDLINDVVPPSASVLAAEVYIRRLRVAKDPAKREELIQQIEGVEKAFIASRERWTAELPPGEMRSLMVDGAIAQGEQYFTVYKTQFLPLVKANEPEKALAILNDVLDPIFSEQQSAVAKVEKIANDNDKRIADSAAASVQSAITTVIALGVCVSVTTIFLGLWISGGIAKPLSHIRDFMLELANGGGNLQNRVDIGDDRSEVGELASSFNKFLRMVNTLLTDIKKVSDEVASSSHRIAAASEETTRSMGLQNESVRDISSLIDQMADTSASVAERTNQAMDAARSTGEVANQGATVVQQTIDSMKTIDAGVTSGAESVSKLGARSQEIGQIIGVINDIADQTNLLALNAAIEAARAGEHGRGFAVVADEVRKLADRTTQATQQVAESIQHIQRETKIAVERMEEGTKEVRSGVELAGTASVGLRQIVEKADHTSKVTVEIASAASQQAEMGAKVRKHIEGLSATSAEVAQASASSNEAIFQLNEKSRHLTEAVQRFSLDNRKHDRHAAPPTMKTPRGKLIDVSAGGVQFESPDAGSLKPGSAITIELVISGVTTKIDSVVAWVRGSRVGVKFDDEVPQLDLVHAEVGAA